MAASSSASPVRPSRPQRFRGVVVSAKSRDTIVVSVETYVSHPKYRKFVRRSKKFHAHDPGNTAPEGAQVVIEASRPYSRLKRFRLVEIVALPREENVKDALLVAEEEKVAPHAREAAQGAREASARGAGEEAEA